MNSIENNICETIEYIVDHAIKNANYDKTIQATIIDCIDPTIGKYKVRFQDSTFYAYTNNIDITYVSRVRCICINTSVMI